MWPALAEWTVGNDFCVPPGAKRDAQIAGVKKWIDHAAILGAPVIHETGLAVAMILGAIALGRGVAEHGFMLPSSIGALGLGVMAGALEMHHGAIEALYTMVGVSILALGHRLNCIAAE